MNAEAQSGSGANGANPSGSGPSGSGLALRFDLDSGPASIPLSRLHHLAGYATLAGEPEEYFLGWLALRGDWIPVFDLNRAVCDRPTPERFGSRILVVKATAQASTPYVGLLAAGVTDTVACDAASVPPLALDSYLPMLLSMIPPLPEATANPA